MVRNATYRQIGGPNGLLARKGAFVGNSMSAHTERDGTYVVVSYRTPIATWRPGVGADVPDQRYSVTTSRQQNLCRAWL